ncbi:alpha/beta hydrolase family protein [Flavobacterium sp.]|uniref:alpha/beta hydrolase family protein n=1 Tax=Flavobacterium sp. TaxID=239 RepID=UPI002C9F3696|nr:prolyl oligopeptidase family serine peptidase [Flavobacterium sp.]HSD06399.1 prolyl oligopeptidase family serine peptidase [Flavobacterium sp.]
MDSFLYNCKIIWISFILFLMTCLVNGQVKKTRPLTQKDYHLWSMLTPKNTSDDGEWVSYTLSYESGMDTLFVKNSVTAKTIVLPKGYSGKFVGNSWFGFLLPENTFQLINLDNGKAQNMVNVQDFTFIKDNVYLIVYCSGTDGKTNIVIKNLKGDTIEKVDNVTSFSMNPKGNAVGYCTSTQIENAVGLLQFGKKITNAIVIKSAVKQFENIVWKRDGKSIVFVGKSNAAKPFMADAVLHYVIESQKLFEYDTTTAPNWPKDMILNANFTSSLGISDDGDRIFFMMKKNDKTIVQNHSGIQIWNEADRDLFPLRSKYGGKESQPRLAAWSPKNGKLMTVGDSVHSIAMLNGNQHYAIVYDPNENKPSWKQEADRDYFLLDLHTGSKTLFLKQQSGGVGNISLSPDGKYIAYFRDRDWWVYSIAKQMHTNITQKTGIAFYDDSMDMAEIQPYGVVGWSVNDGTLLLYDHFDLWQIDPDNGNRSRCTNGREQNQMFRIIENANGYADGIVWKGNEIDDAFLILKSNALDNNFSGYYTLENKQKLLPIVYTQKYISAIHKSKENDSYMYLSEDFNIPPSLIVKCKGKPEKIIFQSNPRSDQYGWSTSKYIDYKNAKGVPMKGVLVYPFDYNPTKQYPMIVYIYEKQTAIRHRYINPTLLNGSGLNASIFASQGYFILYPDIVYTLGNPGFSATDCVTSATNAAMTIAPIDRNRIGLTGHSFGGYETDFIMTQTDMFATAVAGSAITDFVSCYLSININHFKFEGWRFEYEQLRMGKSLFEDFEGYLKNSPISYVSKIKNPIFSYTGILDTQVNPNQNLEFYLALRRLNKKHVMVLYPDDDHVIIKKENQIDLTNKLSEWFGYYLKGENKPEWFESQ